MGENPLPLGEDFSLIIFVVSSETMTDEMVIEYIEKQDIEDENGDFKVDGK